MLSKYWWHCDNIHKLRWRALAVVRGMAAEPYITHMVNLQPSSLLLYTIPKGQYGVHSTIPSSTVTEFSRQDEQSLLVGPEQPPEHCMWQPWHSPVSDSYMSAGQVSRHVEMPFTVLLALRHCRQSVFSDPMQLRHWLWHSRHSCSLLLSETLARYSPLVHSGTHVRIPSRIVLLYRHSAHHWFEGPVHPMHCSWQLWHVVESSASKHELRHCAIGPPVLEVVKTFPHDWQSVFESPLQERHSGEHGWQTTPTAEERVELAALSKYAGGQELPSFKQNS